MLLLLKYLNKRISKVCIICCITDVPEKLPKSGENTMIIEALNANWVKGKMKTDTRVSFSVLADGMYSVSEFVFFFLQCEGMERKDK